MSIEKEKFECLLRENVNNLANLLLSICEDEKNKKIIEETLKDLPFYKIMWFVMLIKKEKIDHQINDFVKICGIIDNEENRKSIKNKLKWFFNVKEILNEKK